jgi:hypothetical protein
VVTVRIAVRRAIMLFLGAMAAAALLLMVGSSPAEAATHGVSAPLAQVSPYQPSPLTGNESFARPSLFSMFGRLPLWAQAALVSAVVTVSFFVLAAFARWAWRQVSDLFSRAT